MNLFEIVSIIFVISFSLSCAFFVRLIIWCCKKKVGGGGALVGSCKNSLVLLCISLSISIVSVAIFFVVIDWEEILTVLELSDYFYYAILFFVIFTATVFFKALMPLFIGLYVLYCGIFIYLFIDSYDIVTKDTSKNANVITISTKSLLPLPRNWVVENSDEERLFSTTLEKVKDSSLLYNSICLLSSMIIKE